MKKIILYKDGQLVAIERKGPLINQEGALFIQR